MKLLCLLALFSVPGLWAWGCDGHQAVALIAEANLNPRAAAQVKTLLGENPVDPGLIRYCVHGRDDLMADASTWPDDIRRAAGTGKWHYMDIPRQVTSGDAGKWCEPVTPANAHGERGGCVMSAILYNQELLKSTQATPADKANALRYLIHFVGDLHQPLHTTDNHDQGGNCAPVILSGAVSVSNLHAVWDSGLLEDELQVRHEHPPAYAAGLQRKFASRKPEWFGSPVSLESWIWESHKVGDEVTYGALQPAIPEELATGKTDCNAETQKVYALHIELGKEYAAKANPVIDEQIAKAGFRLARLLNELWP